MRGYDPDIYIGIAFVLAKTFEVGQQEHPRIIPGGKQHGRMGDWKIVQLVRELIL